MAVCLYLAPTRDRIAANAAVRSITFENGVMQSGEYLGQGDFQIAIGPASLAGPNIMICP